MKTACRSIALLVALALLCCVLTGCADPIEPPVATNIPGALSTPDEAAKAFFDLAVRNDASALRSLYGYPDEAAVRQDFQAAGEDFEQSQIGDILARFETLGATVSPEVGDRLLESVLGMLDRLETSAVVKSIDRERGSAIVTLEISGYSSAAFSAAVTGSAFKTALGSAAKGDPSQLASSLVGAVSEAMDTLSPNVARAVDTEFLLQDAEIAGKPCAIWVPTDLDSFAEVMSTAVFGG